MNPELLARVIGLVQKNGDKVVLADPTTGNGVVVMDLAQYEALVGAAPAVKAAPAPATPAAPAPEPQKTAPLSQNEAKPVGIRVTPETMGPTHILADLTQEQLVDKINRDIGNWKTAQDRKKGEKPAPNPRQPAPPSEPENGIEDEERFFLEPIE